MLRRTPDQPPGPGVWSPRGRRMLASPHTMATCKTEQMTTRTAQCACGRLRVTVRGEPLMVGVCHCDFCQKRSGSVFAASACFGDDQLVEIIGEAKIYNGLKIDGVGTAAGGGSVDYFFCPMCGSSVYHVADGLPGLFVDVGNFVDPDFPAPKSELYTNLRHHWLSSVPAATQFQTLPTTLE